MKKVEVKDTYSEEAENKSFCKIKTFKKTETEKPVSNSNNTASASTSASRTTEIQVQTYSQNGIISSATPTRRRTEVQVQACTPSNVISSGTPTRRRTEVQVQTCTPSDTVSSGTPGRRKTGVSEAQPNFTAYQQGSGVAPTNRNNNTASESNFSQYAQNGLSSGIPTRRRTVGSEAQPTFVSAAYPKENEAEIPINRNNSNTTSESGFSQNAESRLSSGTPTRRRTSTSEIQPTFVAAAYQKENEVSPSNTNTTSESDFSPNTPSRLSSRTSTLIRTVPEAPSRYTLEKRENETEAAVNRNDNNNNINNTVSESPSSPNNQSRLSSGTPKRRRQS